MGNIILPEIVSVGIYNAGAVFKNKTVSPKRKTTMFEIELPIGKGGTSYIDDGSHPISENVVICAKPGQIRHTKFPFKCYYVHAIVNEGEVFKIFSSLPDYIYVKDSREIREIFERLCKCSDTGVPEDEVLMQSLILRLAYTLKRLAPRQGFKHDPKASNREVIEMTAKHISKSLSSDLSLEAISALFGYSPIYFHKLFKASTGVTLREYVEEKRIKAAVALMLSTEMTLTQIAYNCGFSSQAYFNYAFKKRMGCPPREYAKSIFMKYEN